jgi:cysteine desulfurase family protein
MSAEPSTGTIYLDHAATSHPKPAEVVGAVLRALEHGGNPGRGQHARAAAAAAVVEGARSALAELLGGVDPSRIAFTGGATDALNIAIKGTLRPGDHVVTTALEHNSVLRPLRGLADRVGVRVTVVPVGPDGFLEVARLREALLAETRLVVLTHASNVTGAVQPVADVAEACAAVGVPVLLDAAQTAGELPLEVAQLGVAMAVLPGHKGLLGPQGAGALYVREGDEPERWREGGTGTGSESDVHPGGMPGRLEAGTAPVPAIAGLGAGVRLVLERGVAAVQAHQERLTALVTEGLLAIPGVRVYGATDPSRRVGVTAFNIDGSDATEVAVVLENGFGIEVRAGLHCAPLAHRTIGSPPSGAVRVSTGFSTTEGDVEAFLAAVREVATSAG